MERRIGNKFELNDTTLTVVESKDANCDYCFLFKHHLSCSNESTRAVVGACDAYERCDHKDVIFVESEDEKKIMDEAYQFDFSRALMSLKNGSVVRRASWSGNKSIFLAKDIDGIMPFICINTKDGHKGVYTATACDLLAEDWVVIQI